MKSNNNSNNNNNNNVNKENLDHLNIHPENKENNHLNHNVPNNLNENNIPPKKNTEMSKELHDLNENIEYSLNKLKLEYYQEYYNLQKEYNDLYQQVSNLQNLKYNLEHYKDFNEKVSSLQKMEYKLKWQYYNLQIKYNNLYQQITNNSFHQSKEEKYFAALLHQEIRNLINDMAKKANITYEKAVNIYNKFTGIKKKVNTNSSGTVEEVEVEVSFKDFTNSELTAYIEKCKNSEEKIDPVATVDKTVAKIDSVNTKPVDNKPVDNYPNPKIKQPVDNTVPKNKQPVPKNKQPVDNNPNPNYKGRRFNPNYNPFPKKSTYFDPSGSNYGNKKSYSTSSNNDSVNTSENEDLSKEGENGEEEIKEEEKGMIESKEEEEIKEEEKGMIESEESEESEESGESVMIAEELTSSNMVMIAEELTSSNAGSGFISKITKIFYKILAMWAVAILYIRSFFLTEKCYWIFCYYVIPGITLLFLALNKDFPLYFNNFSNCTAFVGIGAYLIFYDHIGSLISSLVLATDKTEFALMVCSMLTTKNSSTNVYNVIKRHISTRSAAALFLGTTPMTATGRAALIAGALTGGSYLFNAYMDRKRLDRADFLNREHTSAENAKNREYTSAESAKNREYTSAESAKNREYTSAESEKNRKFTDYENRHKSWESSWWKKAKDEPIWDEKSQTTTTGTKIKS